MGATQGIYILWERTAPPVSNWDAFLCSVCCILHYMSVCITTDRAGGERCLNLRHRGGGGGAVRSQRIYIRWAPHKEYQQESAISAEKTAKSIDLPAVFGAHPWVASIYPQQPSTGIENLHGALMIQTERLLKTVPSYAVACWKEKE